MMDGFQSSLILGGRCSPIGDLTILIYITNNYIQYIGNRMGATWNGVKFTGETMDTVIREIIHSMNLAVMD